MSFVQIHQHLEYSPLDGLTTVDEAIEQVTKHGQDSLAVTDHGTCAGHATMARKCKAAGIKPLFGIEAYFIDGDRTERSVRPVIEGFPSCNPFSETPYDQGAFDLAIEEHRARLKRLQYGYFHLVLLAQNEVGLRNLWAMSTESYGDGYYYRPRMDWRTLEKYREGVICSTACLRGPVSSAILEDDEELAQARLARLMGIFDDRLYMEIHTNHLEKQFKVNTEAIQLAKTHGIPLVAVVDSHYPTDADKDAHHTWLSVATNKDVQDESELFSQDLHAYIQSEADVRHNLRYLPDNLLDEAINSTQAIADRCDAVFPEAKTAPVYSKVGGRKTDEERLEQLCKKNWWKTGGKTHSDADYVERYEREMRLLKDKAFCGYYLMVADYVGYAKNNGVLVGPARGSGAGSIVAYLSGITEVDPIEADILFERFMTEGRTELPDFDVDFPSSKRDMMQNYVTNKYGDDYVVRVGTHLRLKNKGILKDLRRAYKSEFPDSYTDFEAISKIIDEAESDTAGLGLDWDSLIAKVGDQLAPYVAKYPIIFEMAEKLVGRVKSYGKHAAGIVISTDSALTQTLPLRHSDDGGQMISQFEMGDLTEMGLVKFDFLTIATLDTLQRCLDLIKERKGIDIDIYHWGPEMYQDQKVWDGICRGYTMGIFQIETVSGTRLAKRMLPRNLNDLTDMGTIVRPGPMRSGLTETYLKRRFGEEEITFPDERLAQVLAPTQGTIIFQEQVMAATMLLAGYDSNKADEVRKILGKKLVEKARLAGAEFVDKSTERGMKREDAQHLWDQLEEFSRYSFGKGHAYSYAMLSYWTAWFKFNYPVEFLTAAMSRASEQDDKDRIPDYVREANRMGILVLPPDINDSGAGFTIDKYDRIRYGFDALRGIGEKALVGLVKNQPYTSWDDFEARKAVNIGVIQTLVRVGAFESLGVNRRGIEIMLQDQKDGTDADCIFKNPIINYEGLPCTFNWHSEPIEIGRSGKPLKGKPLPKKCTKACRNYTAPPPVDPNDYSAYTKWDILNIEREMLGVYLSGSPFDRIPSAIKDDCATAEQLDFAPEGKYMVLGLVEEVREIYDRNKKLMAWVKFLTPSGMLDTAYFSTFYGRARGTIEPGILVAAEVKKTDRGYNVQGVTVI